MVETVLGFLEFLGALANTWSIAGTFDVEFEGKQVTFWSWPEATDYVSEFRLKALELAESYVDYSIMKFLEPREEAFRVKTMEMVRGDTKMPWGMALNRALKLYNYFWQNETHILSNGIPSRIPFGVMMLPQVPLLLVQASL